MMSAQQPTNYSKMSLKQLKTLLKSMKVKGVSRLNKKQMLSLLNQRETEQTVAETTEPVKELTPEPTPVKKSKAKKAKKAKKTKVKKSKAKKTKKSTKKVEPVKEPTPEPVKEPTPEPAKEPTPELAKEPTPEPTQEPTQEPTSEPTQEQKPVGKMSLTELKNICRENKIKGFSKMKKSVIVALLTPLFFDEPKEEKEYVHSVFAEHNDVAESRDYLNTMNLKTLRLLAVLLKVKK